MGEDEAEEEKSVPPYRCSGNGELCESVNSDRLKVFGCVIMP